MNQNNTDLGFLLYLTRQDLVDRYSGSVLGGLWTFIMPLVNILIFTLIFSQVMGAKLAEFGADFEEFGYSIYLVAGILAWNAFAATIVRVTNVYREKKDIISKVGVSLYRLPFYVVMAETVIYLISMSFFVGFLWLIDFPFNWNWAWIPLVFVVQQSIAFGLGILFAMLSVFIHDIREFVAVLTQVWFWLTPIVYILAIVPESIQGLYQFNPAFLLIDAYRDIIIHASVPDVGTLGVLALAGVALLALTMWMHRRLERDIRDFI